MDWLDRKVDSRSPRDIRIQRIVRCGLLAVLLLAVLAYVVSRVLAPPNIARNRTVIMSSSAPQAPTSKPSNLTNGVIEGGYGIHTDGQIDATVTVDLERPFRLTEVVVYNRGDGWTDQVLPLYLELSDDGVQFEKVAAASIVFTQREPWRVRLEGRRARYLRLRHPGNGSIALSELEAYGK